MTSLHDVWAQCRRWDLDYDAVIKRTNNRSRDYHGCRNDWGTRCANSRPPADTFTAGVDMSDGTKRASTGTSVRDPVDHLIEVWTRWDKAARRTPKYVKGGHWLYHEAHDLADAITAVGVSGNRLHRLVAAHRCRAVAGHPEGLSIGDAIQAAVNELVSS